MGRVDPLPMNFPFFNKMKVLYEKHGHYYWVLGNSNYAMRLPNPPRVKLKCGLAHASTWIIAPHAGQDVLVKEVLGGTKKRRVTTRPLEETSTSMDLDEEDEEDEEYVVEEGLEAVEEEAEDDEEEAPTPAPGFEQQSGYMSTAQYDHLVELMGGLSTQVSGLSTRMDGLTADFNHFRGYASSRFDYVDEQTRFLHQRMDMYTLPQGFPPFTYHPYPGYPEPSFPYPGYPQQPPPPQEE